MKKVIYLIVLLVIFSGIGYGQKYVIDSAIGDVAIKNQKKSIEAEPGYLIKEGDTIITGKDSECYIIVEKKGYIKVEEKSSITFEQIDKAVKNGTKDNVNVKGSVIFSVSGIFSSNKPLNIKTQTAFATVRGTEFIVEINQKTTTLYVLEGKVAVAPLFSDNEDELLNKSIVVNEDEKIEISEIDVINATSFIKEGDEKGYGVFLKDKKKSLIASEKERFKQRMKMLRELQQKRKEELEKKKKEYLKDPSKLFEED